MCGLCERAAWERNRAHMEHWRRRGNDIERLPGGGFAIKGKGGA